MLVIILNGDLGKAKIEDKKVFSPQTGDTNFSK